MDFSTEEIDAANLLFYNAKVELFTSPHFGVQQFLRSWLKKGQLQGPILDVGAGTGALTEWLKNDGFDILCLDPSSEMLHQCKKKGLKTIQTTIQQFQSKERFATIFAFFSLLHLPKKELPLQLKKIARLLLPNGMFYFSLIEGASEKFFEQEEGHFRFFATYSKEEVFSLLKKSRFELLDCIEYPWFYQKLGNAPIGNSLFFSAKTFAQ